MRRLHDNCTCTGSLLHHGVHFAFRRDIVCNGEISRVGLAEGYSGVVGNTLPRPERELESRPEIEEGNCAMLELGADDAWSDEPKTVAVKPKRPLKVIDTERNKRDARL